MDKDMGEMFLNFPLPLKFKRVLRIELAHYKDNLGFAHLWARDFKP